MRGRRVISPAVYQAIIQGFRAFPTSPNKAAQFACVAAVTARKAWNVGYPKHGYRPVRDILEEEAAITRALRQAAEERAQAAAVLAGAQAERDLLVGEATAEARARVDRAEREARERLDRAQAEHTARVEDLNRRARVDALDQGADEATLSKFARKNVIAMHALVATSLAGAKALAARIAELCTGELDAAGNVKKLTVKQAIEIFRQLTRGVRDLNAATHVAIQLERLRVGDPTEVVAIQDGRPLSLDEAERTLAEAQALLSVANRRLRPKVDVDPAGSNGNGAVH